MSKQMLWAIVKGLRNQQESKNTKGAKIVGKISSSPMIGGQRHSGGVEGVGASIWGMGHCTHTGVKLMNFDVVGNGEAFLGYLIVFPRFFFSDVPKHQLILSVRSIKHRRMSREERHGRLWFFFFCYPERSRSSAKGRQNGEEEEVEDGARIVIPNLREEHTDAEPWRNMLDEKLPKSCQLYYMT